MRSFPAPRPWAALVAATLLVPASAWAQSPPPSEVAPAPAASGIAAPSDGTASPAAVAPLPARITEGTCDEPGAAVADLREVVAGGPEGASRTIVYASISELDMGLAEIATAARVLIIGGGADPDSAVACGDLAGPAQGPADLALVLAPMHSSPYSGTALFHEVDGVTSVYLVIAAAPEPDGSPTPSTAPGEVASPAPTGHPGPNRSQDPADLSPVRSAEPGTSGAPPFSPLPAASPAP